MQIGKRNIKIESTEFKGQNYVGIRQWYESDGELKPGNKGINLKLEEWEELLEKLPEIIEEIKETTK